MIAFCTVIIAVGIVMITVMIAVRTVIIGIFTYDSYIVILAAGAVMIRNPVI